MEIIRKLIEYHLKNLLVKEIFTLIAFEILLLKVWSVLPPAQRDTRNERVKYSVKNQKGIQLLLKSD